MKSLYIFFILSLISCRITFKEIDCILNELSEIVEHYLMEKDLKQILSAIPEAYSSLKNGIQKCLNKEPNLKIDEECFRKCHVKCYRIPSKTKKCMNECLKDC